MFGILVPHSWTNLNSTIILSVEIINSWYDASIAPGSSGYVLPDFTVGDLSLTGGGSDRLEPAIQNLTRYDENIDDYEDFKGKNIYQFLRSYRKIF